MTYRKWDLGWAGLDPSVGHEQAGRRPVLVLSNNAISQSIGLVAIVPLTTWKKGPVSTRRKCCYLRRSPCYLLPRSPYAIRCVRFPHAGCHPRKVGSTTRSCEQTSNGQFGSGCLWTAIRVGTESGGRAARRLPAAPRRHRGRRGPRRADLGRVRPPGGGQVEGGSGPRVDVLLHATGTGQVSIGSVIR